MKNKITLYLFVFTALVLIFQLVNSKKILDDQTERLINLKTENKFNVAAILKLQNQLDEVNDFSLEENEYALSYFKDIDIKNITNRIKDQLYEKNLLMDKDELIPYATMDRTFLINKVKVLNHKWLIANFSDGTLWGELLIFFKVDKSGDISFELKEYFLYPSRE
jgi:hypothetical protein